jgi:hypothetical protein
MAADIMEARTESTYAKGLQAYDAWKDMLLDDSFFVTNSGFDSLFSMILVQNDAVECIRDGRKWGAVYFNELADRSGTEDSAICLHIAEAFLKVSKAAVEMKSILGSFKDTENMLRNFSSRSIRERLGKLIDLAKREDTFAYEQIQLLLNHM